MKELNPSFNSPLVSSKVIAFINIFLCLPVLFYFFQIGTQITFILPLMELSSIKDTTASLVVFLVIPLTILLPNAFSAYKILSSKNPTQKAVLAGSSIAGITASILVILTGQFFSTEPIFYIFLLLFLVFYTFANWQNSKKGSFVLIPIFVLASLFTIQSSFEENYCWARGTEAYEEAADKGESTWAYQTEDVSMFEKGASVTVAYRAHIDCHKSYDFYKAIKDKIF